MTGVRIRQRIDVLEGPKSGVSNPRAFAILFRDTSNAGRVLVNRYEGGDRMEQAKVVSELNVFRAFFLAEVKGRTNSLRPLLRPKRPQSLELSVI